MSLTPSLNKFSLVGLLAAFAAVGCSDYDSSFVYSERTTSLMPEAQDGIPGTSDQPAVPGVKQLLDDHFGNPQNIKAWLKLPVDFGGTQATVAEIVAKADVFKIKLSVEEGQSLPSTAKFIEFVSGAAAGRDDQSHRLGSSDWRCAVLAGTSSKRLLPGIPVRLTVGL